MCLCVLVSLPDRARTLLWSGGSGSHPLPALPTLGPVGAASPPLAWSRLNPHPFSWILDEISLALPSQGPCLCCPPSLCRGTGGYLAGQQAGTDLFGLWIYYPTLPVEVALLPCGESGSHEPQGHFWEGLASSGQRPGRAGPKAGEPLALESGAAAFQRYSSGHQQLSAGCKNHPVPMPAQALLWGAPSLKQRNMYQETKAATGIWDARETSYGRLLVPWI